MLSTNCFAYSGMGDGMMDQMINIVAICTVILIVQLVIWLFFRRQLKISRYSQKLYERGVKVCANRYRAIFTFWLLASFIAAPYFGVISAFTMGGIWLVLLTAGFIFFRKWREQWITPQKYSLLINMSLGQTVGLFTYCLVFNLPIFKKIFFYDWGEVPELGFYSYANGSAYGYLLISFVESLAVLFILIIVYASLELIKPLWNRCIKHQK